MRNRWLLKSLVVGTGLLALASCVQPTPYQPQEGRYGAGYSDQRLAANRYRIVFTGNSATARTTVEDYLLRRAAEVTMQAGYNYFMFDTRNTEARTDYYTQFANRWPGSRFSAAWYWHNWYYDPYGYSSFGSDFVYSETRYQAYAEIVLLTGAQAAAEPTSMEARDVMSHLAPQP